jgi:hypothetical protein
MQHDFAKMNLTPCEGGGATLRGDFQFVAAQEPSNFSPVAYGQAPGLRGILLDDPDVVASTEAAVQRFLRRAERCRISRSRTTYASERTRSIA